MLFQDNQNEKAVKQANLLLELRRAEPQLGFYLALLMLEKDLVDESEAVFKKILVRYPQNTTPYYYLGLIELQRENDEQALEYFTKVKDPNNLLPALSRISDLLDNADKRAQLQKIMLDARNSTFRNGQYRFLSLKQSGWICTTIKMPLSTCWTKPCRKMKKISPCSTPGQ